MDWYINCLILIRMDNGVQPGELDNGRWHNIDPSD